MMKILQPPRLLAAAAAVLLSAAASAAAVEPFTAEYQANVMGMQGNGQMVLAPQGGNRWQYSLRVSNSLADLVQNTVFDEHEGRLRPLSSSDQSRFLVKRKSVTGTYDWDSAQARWSGDIKPDRAGPVKLQPGDMDGLLINLAVARDFAAGKPLSYRMVEDGRVRQVALEVVGKDKVTVNGKTHEATKLLRSDGRKEIIAWVVSGMPVPARLLQREDGKDTIDLQIKTLR